MIQTWSQRMHRTLLMFYRSGLLSEDDVSFVHRAPFFGAYRWALHCTPVANHLFRFEELRQKVAEIIAGADAKLTYCPAIWQMNLHGNDPEALRAVLRFNLADEDALLDFNSIHVIDQACWGWRLPPPKPKGLYYGKYAYRIRFRDKRWAGNPTNIAALANVTGDWMVGPPAHRQNFLYCAEARDVILAKLLFSDEIQEIADRSHLRTKA